MKNEPCNNEADMPFGRKHICRQKHVKITLKALKEGDESAIVDEQFYYPSHCVCELVNMKKKEPLRRASKLKCRPINSGLLGDRT